ncbi:MAG: efflux RND transporter periplasmic adaptor subunit [Phycisphaerae bacterium]
MKKWVLLLLVVAVISVVWYWLRTYYRYVPEWDKAKFGEVTRDDIRVPITASGLIEANQRIDIRSKAAGEVIDIRVVEGNYVKKGDVLVLLKKDDEERQRHQAKAALTRMQALLAQAEVAVEQAKQRILTSEAQVQEIKARGEIIAFDLERAEELTGSAASDRELVTARANARINAAQLETAEANLEVAKNNLKDAQQAVIIQQAAVEEAQKQLEDAEERLEETTIQAPRDAIVTDVRVSVGNLVQSATRGLTGGTPVMELADVSKLKVVTRVDEADIGRVLKISPVDSLPELPGLREAVQKDAEMLEKRTGHVQLTVDAFPDETFEGLIERVEPQGKLNTGSAIIQFDVHVEVTDERRSMLPLGTQAQVEFTVESVTDALLVPAEAVMTFQDERGVWVKTPPEPGSRDPFGKKFVAYRVGISDGAHTQLIAPVIGEPLEEGQEVFTKLPRERGED